MAPIWARRRTAGPTRRREPVSSYPISAVLDDKVRLKGKEYHFDREPTEQADRTNAPRTRLVHEETSSSLLWVFALA